MKGLKVTTAAAFSLGEVGGVIANSENLANNPFGFGTDQRGRKRIFIWKVYARVIFFLFFHSCSQSIR